MRKDEPCTNCGGGGVEIVGKNLVTLDMAIDAGDRSMEGMFHSYAYAECHVCEGTGVDPHQHQLPATPTTADKPTEI